MLGFAATIAGPDGIDVVCRGWVEALRGGFSTANVKVTGVLPSG